VAVPRGRALNADPAPFSHRAGHRARRLRFPQARAPRSQIFGSRSLDAKLHMHPPVDAPGVWPAAEACRRRSKITLVTPILPGWPSLGCARMGADLDIRLGPVSGETGVVGHRLLILGARRIVLGLDARGRRQSGEAKRNRCGAPGHRPQLRRTASVRLDASATIFDIAASISASVRVRSRGCRITWMAMDFDPSGKPSP